MCESNVFLHFTKWSILFSIPPDNGVRAHGPRTEAVVARTQHALFQRDHVHNDSKHSGETQERAAPRSVECLAPSLDRSHEMLIAATEELQLTSLREAKL